MRTLYINKKPQDPKVVYEIEITRLVLWKYVPCEGGATKVNGKDCVLEIVDIVEITAEHRQYWIDRFNKEAKNWFHAHIDEEYVPCKEQPLPPIIKGSELTVSELSLINNALRCAAEEYARIAKQTAESEPRLSEQFTRQHKDALALANRIEEA